MKHKNSSPRDHQWSFYTLKIHKISFSIVSKLALGYLIPGLTQISSNLLILFVRYLRSIKFLFYTKPLQLYEEWTSYPMFFFTKILLKYYLIFFYFCEIYRNLFFYSLNPLVQRGYKRSCILQILQQTFLVASWFENVRPFITTRKLKD